MHATGSDLRRDFGVTAGFEHDLADLEPQFRRHRGLA